MMPKYAVSLESGCVWMGPDSADPRPHPPQIPPSVV